MQMNLKYRVRAPSVFRHPLSLPAPRLLKPSPARRGLQPSQTETVSAAEVPVVICNGNTVLKHPSIQRLAACLGFNASIDSSDVRDLVIVGAGPAGLAGAVYAASEGHRPRYAGSLRGTTEMEERASA
jgi:hypothetical protein